MRKGMARIWLLLAWLIAVSAPTLSVAEPVRVRGGVHEGYGRIVFTWQSPVTFKAAVDGQRLNIDFGRDIEADYAQLLRVLRAYVTAASTGADGRSVDIALRGPFALRSFDLGSSVIVDLLRNGDTAAAPPGEAQPAQTPQTVPTVPTVGVRYGVHSNFDRVVFDWPRPVPYRIERDGERAVVTFARPARIETGNRPRLRNLRGLSAETRDNELAVTLTVPENVRLRDFLSGPKVVLDIGGERPMPPPQPPAAQVPAAQAPAPSTAEQAPQEPAEESETAAAPAPAPETDKPQEVAKATEPAPEPAPESKPAPKPETETASDREPATLPATEAVASATPAPATDAPAPQPDAEAAEAKPGLAPPISLIPKSQTGGVAATQPATPGAAPTAVGDIARGAVPGAAPLLGGTKMRFDWPQPVAASIFRRAGALWVVFDAERNFDAKALKLAADTVVRQVERVPAEGATVFRMQTLAGLNPDIRREGLAWILEFKRQPLTAAVPIESKTQLDSPLGARLFLPIPEPGKAIALTDPAVGDNFVVVPVIPLGHGVLNGYDYPQLRIPATAQGVVIEPKTDGIRVRPIRQGVEVTSATTLYVTPVSAEERAESRLSPKGPLTRVLALERWRDLPLQDFTGERQALQRAVAEAEEENRNRARMNLAKFYFANRYAPEALGVLRSVEREQPEAVEEADFRLLRGGANLMLDRLPEAEPDLKHASLDDSDEGTFWRAVLAAEKGAGATAAADLKRTGAIIRPYPKALRTPLGILIAGAAVDAGDVSLAEHRLDALRASDPSPPRQAEIGYVEGCLEELRGEVENAVVKWEEVQAGAHRPSRARATKDRAELLLHQGQITPAEAIEELESLRFTWRGDEFEFNLLQRLGDLYLSEGDYRKGLRTLRQAATHFREHPEAAQVTQRMTETFHNLYQQGEADNLAPVSAIALYEEFKELTPPGDAGDEMIRKLADRLVGVDLLDRAAGLLDNQVNFRLKGEQKARVGARLALVRLLNREPEKAIKALDDSAGDNLPQGLPGDLVGQRRLLRAQAHADRDQYTESLALISEDKSREAEELRAEIYWQQREWRLASQSLRRLAQQAGVRAGKPLAGVQSKLVMNLAVALTLGSNERGVDRLRRDYGAAMDESRFREAFRLITLPPQRGLIEPDQIAGKVENAENFVTFMARYREDLTNGKLSNVN